MKKDLTAEEYLNRVMKAESAITVPCAEPLNCLAVNGEHTLFMSFAKSRVAVSEN